MKKVLIVSYFFPPVGGGSVMRVTKFCKYLPEFGWSPTVLTAAQHSVVSDPTLLNELPDGVKVIRVPVSVTQRIKQRFIRRTVSNSMSHTAVASHGIRRIAEKVFLALQDVISVPDQYKSWGVPALHHINTLLRTEKFDAIITTSPPHSVHNLGSLVAKRYRIPWIADFRDPWVGNPLFTHRFSWHRSLASKMEKNVIEKAQRVLVVTDHMQLQLTDRYSGVVPNLNEKVLTLTNGWDEDDFVGLKAKNSPTSQLLISYVGSIGGTRSSYPLLDALTQLRKFRPDVFKDIAVRFVGLFSDSQQRWKNTMGNQVYFNSHVPHRESLQYMLDTDVLLVVLHAAEAAEFAYTGKVFEYIGSGRPILGLTGDSLASKLILRERLGWAVDPMNTLDITNTLIDIHALWKRDSLPKPKTAHLANQFGRKALTKRLAGILNNILYED